jgi:hypothetical protein
MSWDSDANVGWYFERQPCGKKWDPGLLTKKSLSRSIETLIRETFQNINDQGPVSDGPVVASLRLHRYTGEEASEFLNVIDPENELSTHVQAAAEEQDIPGISEYLNYVERENEFRVLVVEGQNTTGIQGDEGDRESDYGGLVWSMGQSNKEEGSGGHHGIGKTAYWMASGLQTVLFASNLNQELEGQESPRFVGRTYFPTHQLSEGECYDGKGWFGDRDSVEDDRYGRPTSVWDGVAEEMIERFDLDRPDEPGTSAMILGFRDPSDPSMDNPMGLKELVDAFETAAAERFWPAIRRGDLEVNIEVDGIERVLTRENIAEYGRIAPFVEAFDERFDAPEGLGGLGSVASINIPFEIEEKKDPDADNETQGFVTLCVRRASPTDDPKMKSHVAMFRKPGMVVDYKPMRHLPVEGNFHAVLVCGEARAAEGQAPTPADEAIDEFLQLAEPPTHDEWFGENNDELKGTYKQGCVSTVEDELQKRLLRDNLVNLLTEETERSSERLTPTRDILPKTRAMTRDEEPSPASRSPFDWSVDMEFRDNRWEFDGYIEPSPDEHGPWEATFSLVPITEDNTEMDPIPIASFDSDEFTVSEGKGRISRGADVHRITFSGKSVTLPKSDPRTGDVSETKFKIEDGRVAVVEIEEAD